MKKENNKYQDFKNMYLSNYIRNLYLKTIKEHKRNMEQVYFRYKIVVFLKNLNFTNEEIGKILNLNHSTITYLHRKYVPPRILKTYFDEKYEEFFKNIDVFLKSQQKPFKIFIEHENNYYLISDKIYYSTSDIQEAHINLLGIDDFVLEKFNKEDMTIIYCKNEKKYTKKINILYI